MVPVYRTLCDFAGPIALSASVCSSVEGMRRWHESHYFPCDGLRMINEKIVRRVPQPDHFDMCAILAEGLDLLAARCTDRLSYRQQDPSLLGWELPDSIQVQITSHEEERRLSDAALKIRAGFHAVSYTHLTLPTSDLV